MANSPLFFDAARSGKQSADYRVALAQLGIDHDAVKAEAARLKGATC